MVTPKGMTLVKIFLKNIMPEKSELDIQCPVIYAAGLKLWATQHSADGLVAQVFIPANPCTEFRMLFTGCLNLGIDHSLLKRMK